MKKIMQNLMKSELKWKHFGFVLINGEEESNLFTSNVSWASRTTLLLFRLVITVYLIIATVLSITKKTNPETWFLFMTSINYLFVLFYFISAVHLSLRTTSPRRQIECTQMESASNLRRTISTEGIEDHRFYPTAARPVPLKLRHKVHWILSSVALNLSIAVTIVYWTLLYTDRPQTTALQWFLRVDRHGVMLIWVLIDHLNTKTPIRVLHFVYPALVFTLYMVVNTSYSWTTDKLIYSIIDMKNSPVRTSLLIVGGIALVFPIIQFSTHILIDRLKSSFAR